jgi:hypothetical protein
VPGDDRLVALEQLGQLPQREPGRFSVESHLDVRPAILGLVEEDLGFVASHAFRLSHHQASAF